MSVVAPSLNTVSFIRTIVRELCGCPGEQQLKTAYIDQTLNNFYLNDFPYAIKLDQMRDVYSFYTTPYVGYYPLDVNYNQGVRSPCFIDGIQSTFYKDREDYFRIWPRWPTFFNNQFNQSSPTGGITYITQSSNGVVTSPNHGLSSGADIYINNVQGMTEVNGENYSITVLTVNTFELNIDTSIYTPYSQGGTWWELPIEFSFTLPGPFLQNEVVIGGTYFDGTPFSIRDDNYGNLQLLNPNPQTSNPPNTTNPALGGMYNLNLGNPGVYNPTNVGTVNYVVGNIFFTLPQPLQAGTNLSMNVSQYQPGRPYSVLFWNNYFIVRPIPKYIHKVEVDTYLTPVQFMSANDNPILLQWSLYLAYGCAAEILRRRQDTAGLANVMEGFKRQEDLVLERQGTEELYQRNKNIFSESTPSSQWGNGIYGGWGY